MSLKKSLSLLLALCLMLSAFAGMPVAVTAADTEIADTGANVEIAETGSSNLYGLADNIQDGQILQCWGWSFNNIKANLQKIAQQGFSAIQTSPIQSSKESTREYYSTFYNSSWVYYQPISFAIETNSYNSLGTKSDFESMCAEAEEYGIKVIVDTVFNHMANDMTENTIHPYVPSDLYNDSSCWHDISKNCSNYSDRYDITHYCLSGLPDLNTSHSTVQNYCIGFLKECIDAGADGFRFDAAKHIETPSDSSGTASDFWPNVLNAATEYAQSTYGTTPYYYGELLDDPGDGNIGAYTAYMSVTDNQGSNTIRSCVCNGDAAGAANPGIFNGAAPSKTVQWTESHDTHKDSGTSGVSEHNINKTWAIVGSRAEVCGQYLARPSDMSTTMLGSADVTSWSYPEVKAVNQFKNHFIGKSEYFSSYNNLACVERGTSGMIIVNVGGTYYNGMSAPVHTMASGTYTDAITGNTFTVADGYISGDIGDTGIAVVYDVENSGLFTEGTVTDFAVAGSFNSWDTTADKMIAVDGNTVSTTMFLDQGTYEFKITTTTGIWYGNADTISDSTGSSGKAMKASVDSNCTLDASGGKYTFKFNVSTGTLVVEYENTTDTTSDFYLKGSFNDWSSTTPLVYASGDNVVSASVTLEAGTYTFKINNPVISVWYGNSGTINDYTGSGGWTMSPDVSDNCTLVASGGTYNFAFNLSTQKLVVSSDSVTETTSSAETTTTAQTTVADVTEAVTTTVATEAGTGFYLKGDFNGWTDINQFTSTEDSNVVTYTLDLDAGTYGFKVYDANTSKWRGNPGTINDTTGDNGWTMSSSESSNCTLVATGGTYTFNFNTSTCKIIVLHTPAETDPVETTKATFTVTFKDFDGTVLSQQSVTEGESATAPADPAREADAQYTYTFSGWDTDYTNITANTTVTATYSKTINKYTVTFTDYDGTVISEQSVEYGSAATAPADPVREGYTFTGWDAAFDNVTEDITVTAVYVDAAVYLKGSFNDWGETGIMLESESDSNVYTITLELAEGTHTFKIYHENTWYGNNGTIADTTVTTSSGGWQMETGKSNCTLKASGGKYTFNYDISTHKLIILYTAPEYTVTFKDYDGSVINAQTVSKGESATAPVDPAREADAQYTYTFAGWDTDFTNITADTTVTATYTQTVNKYTVTFVDYDGAVLSEQSVEYGKSATAPAEPEREATAQYTYTFAGWDTDYSNITADTTVTATYTRTVNKYTVTFVDYDGTVLSEQSVEYGNSAIAPADPARDGYVFAGWDKAFNNITTDITITAQYTEASEVYYTVTFKDWNGTVLKTETVPHGGSATPPLEPLRESTTSGSSFMSTTTYYIFKSWDGDYTNVQADTTVTATYTTETSNFINRVYYYFVYFKDWDGTVLKQQNVKSGTTVTPPADPTREGYTFAGWDKTNFTITAETTFTATYTEIVDSYTVTFVDYDGTVLSTQSVESGKSATAPANPAREATAQYTYTFAGWDTDYSNITADTTVTATYTQTVNKYKVTFVDYDGSVINEQSVEYGSSATAPSSPVRDGYTFTGWEGAYTNIVADTTVTATYTENAKVYYTVEFVDYDGTVLDTQTVEEGTAATAPVNPARESTAQYTYTFAGWDTDYSNITADTTVTATYTQTINKYTVTFVDYDGTVLSAQNVEYGSSATAPSSPVRDGYTFTGWDTDFTNIKEDTTVTAVYAEIGKVYFTVVYLNADNTFLGLEKVEAGAAAVGIADPTKAADAQYTYTFAGWDADLTAITADTVVTAQYDKTVNKYTVTFLDKDGKAIGEAQSVEYGAAATAPEAPAVDGYTFTGWDVAFDNITADTTVTAQYSKNKVPVEPATTGKLRLEVAGGTGFTIAFGDGAARPQGTSYMNTKAPINATVTVVANAIDGLEFMGWVNEAGAVFSTTETFTFTTSGNDYYKAMYATDVENVSLVVFKNDKAFGGNGQILEMQYYAAGDEIVFPADANFVGFDFTGWSMTAEEIQAEIAAGNDVTVLATWVRAQIYFAVEVEGGKVTNHGGEKDGKYLGYSAVTVTADAAPSGQKFAYWKDGSGKIVSYDAEYKFYIAADTALTAVYVAESEEVVKTAIVTIVADPNAEANAEKIRYYLSWNIPESVASSIVNVGFITVNEADYKEETFMAGSSDTNVFTGTLNSAYNVYSSAFAANKSSSKFDNTYVAATWVKYIDAETGETVVIYSDPVVVYKPAP